MRNHPNNFNVIFLPWGGGGIKQPAHFLNRMRILKAKGEAAYILVIDLPSKLASKYILNYIHIQDVLCNIVVQKAYF